MVRRRLGNCFAVYMPPFGRLVYVADPAGSSASSRRPGPVPRGRANALVFEQVLGENSLLVLDEERHLKERKLLLPHFHGESVRRYAETDERGAAARSSRGLSVAHVAMRGRCSGSGSR